MSTFDVLADIEQKENQARLLKPFWKVDLNDEKELLEWINGTYQALRTVSRARIERMQRNIAAYRGISFRRTDISRTRDFTDSPRRSRIRNLRIQVNNLYDIIEQNVSRETRFRPAVNFLPATDDHNDKMAGKVVEHINEGIWYRENIDDKMQEHSRFKKILGENYLMACWDENSGDYQPDWVKEVFKKNGIKKDPEKLSQKEINKIFRDEIKKMPTITITDPDDGTKVKIEKPVRIGEIKYKHILALNMFHQPKRHYDEVEWSFYVEWEDIDTLKAKHPDKAEQIKESDNLTVFDSETMEEKRLQNQVLIIHLWHRGTEQLDKGRYIKATPDAILENKENPVAQLEATNGFPWIRGVDIQIPNQLYGVAAIEYGRPLQEWINNLSSLLVRQQALAAHPKWVAPLNSVKAEALGNDSTIMWYKGAVPPKLEQPNPGAANTFKLLEIFEKKLQQIMGVFGVSRGEPPTGVKAGVALQFLNEQEDERANAQIAQHNGNIRDLASLTIFLAGENYDESDERLEKVLGSSNARLAKYFDIANLAREWDVRAQTASALPQQKAQRVQTLLDLRREFPERVDDDEVLDMIGFGAADKFITINTQNIRSAESENDDILRGGKASAPVEWENHITHYRIHIRKLNEPESKDGTVPKGRIEALKKHIAAHEMLIEQLIQKGALPIQAVLQEFPFYPLFMNEAPAPEAPIMPGGQPSLEEIDAAIAQQGAVPQPAEVPPGSIPQEFPQVENQLPLPTQQELPS